MATEYFNDAWRIPNNKNQSLVSNYSMEFNGTSTDIDLGSEVLFDSTKGFSFSSWVNLTSYNSGYPTIVKLLTDQSDDFILSLSSQSGYTGVFFGSPSQFAKGRTTGDISGDFIGVWKHICLTFDGVNRGVLSSYKIYVDGSLVSLVNANAIGAGTSINSIGYGGFSNRYFNGLIDQVSIFDYALPATGTNSVATLYGGGTAVTNPMSLSPKPVAAYKLGDQSVSTGSTADYLVPNNSLQDYVFNFTSSKITLDSEITLPDNKSTSLWVKFNSVPQTQFAIILSSSTNNWFPLVSKNALGNFVLYYKGGDGSQIAVATTVAAVAGVWYNFVTTGDGSIFNLYINGDNAYAGGVGSDREDVKIKIIGTRPAGGFFVDGQMSNVAFWSGTTLTPSQVNNVYNNGSPNDISSLNPTLWYKLNAQDTFDGANWTIKDSAGSNDGTSNGMTSANLVQSNLQHTSGYSPYALTLDSNVENYFILNNGNGNGLLNAATSFTISAWINPNQPTLFGTIFSHFTGGVMLRFTTNGTIQLYVTKEDNSFSNTTAPSALTFSNNWQHVVATYDGSFLRIYVNNVLVNTPFAFSDTLKNDTSSSSDNIGNRAGGNPNQSQYFDGEISNVAVWKNTVINVTTLYNQGVPADLTSLNPSGWWQMGSNSSFDANTSKWTCLNEGTARTSAVPSNATTFAGNMTNDDIVNGVGYSANGLGTSSIEIVGDAPYSTANGISENMDVLDRVTDVPS